jgi:thioredoxin reductase (NADPH)
LAKPVLFTIDDEPQVLHAVERDLRRRYGAEYRLMKAGSGAEALEALRQLKARGTAVALLLADQRMPGMTGTEFLAEALKLYPEAKKALLTAYADTEAAIQSINTIGLDYYLMKPWDPPEQHLYPVLDDLLADFAATVALPYDGTRVLGTTYSPQSYLVKEFLSRNHVPYQWVDLEQDAAMRALVGAEVKLPVVLLPDGQRLEAPDLALLAERVGLKTHAANPFYDLVIVGAGPAGLAAAVYAGSEGLKTIMIEKKAPGGQAGSSSFIENYLGFPKGLSGADLARRATTQARRFGVEIVSGEAVKVAREDPYRAVTLGEGTTLRCHAVVLASGMTTRQLPQESAAALVGRGVYYGASLAEAAAYRGQDIFVVGAANSAGQGALFFARSARKVTLLVRGESLEESMSYYLVQQLRSTANVEVLLQIEISEAHGTDRLEALTVEMRGTGERRRLAGRALFVFIGAVPHSDLGAELLARDDKGFVLTGRDLLTESGRAKGWNLKREPYPLETSVPGIFAVGDVRAGSMKRVASAVGEGANAVALVHQYLKSV